jgi:regulator of sigma E protease
VSIFSLRRGEEILTREVPVLAATGGHSPHGGLRHIVLFPRRDSLVGSLLENSPAARGGMIGGDVILAVDGQEVYAPEMVQEFFQDGQKEHQLTILRRGETVTLSLTPRNVLVRRAYGEGMGGYHRPVLFLKEGEGWRPIGCGNDFFSHEEVVQNFFPFRAHAPIYRPALGILFQDPVVYVHRHPFALLWESMKMAWQTLLSLVNYRSDIGARHLMGFPGIARLMHHLAEDNFRLLLTFIVHLNVGLAIINLLPIPALDGGTLFLCILEKVSGHAIPRRLTCFLQTLSIILLFALMIYVSFCDILRWRHDRQYREQEKLYPPPSFSL